VGEFPTFVTAGDFNGDGKPDLVVTQDSVFIFLGDGHGGFAAPATYGANITPASVAVGDLNGDGIVDLAVANAAFGNRGPGSNRIGLLWGVGDGTFMLGPDFPVGTSPTSIAEGDLDGDGVIDLVVTNNSDATISVFLGRGAGAFVSAGTYPTGGQPWTIAVADFDRDGRPDLAFASSLLHKEAIVLLNSSCSTADADSSANATTCGAALDAGYGRMDSGCSGP
jgi:hypothetical protein